MTVPTSQGKFSITQHAGSWLLATAAAPRQLAGAGPLVASHCRGNPPARRCRRGDGTCHWPVCLRPHMARTQSSPPARGDQHANTPRAVGGRAWHIAVRSSALALARAACHSPCITRASSEFSSHSAWRPLADDTNMHKLIDEQIYAECDWVLSPCPSLQCLAGSH